MDRTALISVLEWHLSHGVDEVIGEQTLDWTAHHPVQPLSQNPSEPGQIAQKVAASEPIHATHEVGSAPLQGTPEIKDQAIKLAGQAQTLSELEQVILTFEGLELKQAANHIVFAEGSPSARIMLIGEAPGGDEDREGRPFVGQSGQLLDKILACIGLSRTVKEPETGVYITNVLNWRPPGNRSPTPQEIEISRPFIERHIDLAAPEYLILCGGIAAQVLLQSRESISKLREKWHDYRPQTLENRSAIPAIVTYHPAYLLRTPTQKAKVWQDMLQLQDVLLER